MSTLISFEQQSSIKPIGGLNHSNSVAINSFDLLSIEVEEFELDKLLGSAFYQDIINNIGNYTDLIEGSEFQDCNDNTLRQKGIRYVLAYLNYAKWIGESYVKDTHTGMVQKIRTDSERISTGDIKRLQSDYRSIAMNAFSLIEDYLNLNTDTYTLWKQSESRNVNKNTMIGIKKTYR